MLEANKAASVSYSAGFRRMFGPDRLSLGLFFPIEAFERDQPSMRDQPRLARRAEELGFSALWTRDVPLRDPSFGDLGQVYDPWVWLGWIAAHTSTIALATGSIILPLRHPFHIAKASASVDQLTGGRFVLGVASGDRPVEFPAFGVDWHQRDVLFRENLAVIRKVLAEEFPRVQSSYGTMMGMADVVPKPVARLPILITGSSRQGFDWIAAHADGWITYMSGWLTGKAGAPMLPRKRVLTSGTDRVDLLWLDGMLLLSACEPEPLSIFAVAVLRRRLPVGNNEHRRLDRPVPEGQDRHASEPSCPAEGS